AFGICQTFRHEDTSANPKLLEERIVEAEPLRTDRQRAGKWAAIDRDQRQREYARRDRRAQWEVGRNRRVQRFNLRPSVIQKKLRPRVDKPLLRRVAQPSAADIPRILNG